MTDQGRLYWLTIEGVGPGRSEDGPPDGLWRFCTQAPAIDPDGLWLPWLWSYPTERPEELSFLNGTLELGAMAFDLLDTDAQTLWTTGLSPSTLGQVLMGSKPQVWTRLASPLASASTNLTTVDTSGALEDQLVWVGREAILVGASVSPGLYTGCQRAQLGTTAQAHTTDLEVFVAPHVLTDRVVTFGLAPLSGDWLDAQTLWTGVLEDVAEASESARVLRVNALSLVNRVRQRPIMRQLWRGRVVSAQAGPGGAGVLDTWLAISGPASLSQRPQVDASDLRAVIMVDGGWPVVCQATWIPNASDPDLVSLRWAPEIDARPTGPYLVPPDPDLNDLGKWGGKDCWQVWLVGQDAPLVNGDPLPANPISLARVLLTDGQGWPDLGAGLPPDLLDSTWDDLANYFQGFEVGHLVLGAEGQPQDVWELVTQRLLRPIQVVPTVRDGRLSLARFSDAMDLGDTTALPQSVWLSPGPRVARNLPSAFDEVQLEVSDWPGGKARQVRAIGAFQRARQEYGRRRALAIDAAAFSAPPPSDLARWMGLAWVEQFAAGYPVLTGQVAGDLSLYPGQRVLVTHPQVHGPTGRMGGLTRVVCLLLSATWRAGGEGQDSSWDVVALVVGAPLDRVGAISGSLLVTGWQSLTRRAEVYLPAFTDPDPGTPLADDLAAFQVGWLVDVVDRYWAAKGSGYQGLAIQAVSRGTRLSGAANPDYGLVTLPVGTPALTAGDHLQLSTYTAHPSDVQALWAWVADTAGDVDGVPGYQWGA